MYRMNKCAVGFFLNSSSTEVPWTTRPGNTAVHPEKLRFWTANQQSVQRKAPFASQPHCFVTLEIKTSYLRGCNTPQLRNMWHHRICPLPVTFLRSWRTLRCNCRTQSSRDCTACLQSAPTHPFWKHDGDGSRFVTPDGSRWGDSTICRRGSPDWTSVRDLQKKKMSNFLEKLFDIDQQLVLARQLVVIC